MKTALPENARDYLVQDFLTLHKQRKRTAIMGIALVVLVFCYMTWLSMAISHMTKPENLADAMAGYVEVSLPDWKRSAKSVVQDEAPRVAHYVGETVVRELPPVLRTAIENMVTQYTSEIAETAVKHLDAAFTDLVSGAKEELRQAADMGLDNDQAALMVKALDRQLQRAEADASKNPFDETVLQKLHKSQKALASLNDRLEKLLAPGHEPDTRRGKLERRFIMTFWRFMQQESPDLRVKDGGKAGK